MKEAVLYLKSGREIEIKVSDNFAVDLSDFTEKTVHRFPLRKAKGMMFVQGDRIDFISVNM